MWRLNGQFADIKWYANSDVKMPKGSYDASSLQKTDFCRLREKCHRKKRPCHHGMVICRQDDDENDDNDGDNDYHYDDDDDHVWQ